MVDVVAVSNDDFNDGSSSSGSNACIDAAQPVSYDLFSAVLVPQTVPLINFEQPTCAHLNYHYYATFIYLALSLSLLIISSDCKCDHSYALICTVHFHHRPLQATS